MNRDLMDAFDLLARSGYGTDLIVNAIAMRKAERADRLDQMFNPNGHEPRREEIETGPSFGASGRGASEMTRHYSRPAEQLVSTKVGEALSRLLDDVAELEKAYKLLAANHRGLTKIVGRLAAETGRLDIAKALAVLLSKASAETDDAEDETEEERKKREEREASEKGGQRSETMALLAGMGSGTVGDLLGAMLGGGQRPVAKASSAVDQIVVGLDTDVDAGVLSPIDGLAGKSAAVVCKAAIEGHVLPGFAKSRIDCLPASVAQRFAGLFQ